MSTHEPVTIYVPRDSTALALGANEVAAAIAAEGLNSLDFAAVDVDQILPQVGPMPCAAYAHHRQLDISGEVSR